MFRGTCGGDSWNRSIRDPMEDNLSMDRDKHEGGQAGLLESSFVGSDESMVGICDPTDNDGSTVMGFCGSAENNVQYSNVITGIGDGCELSQPDSVYRGRTNHGDTELVRMDVEGADHIDASS